MRRCGHQAGAAAMQQGDVRCGHSVFIGVGEWEGREEKSMGGGVVARAGGGDQPGAACGKL